MLDGMGDDDVRAAIGNRAEAYEARLREVAVLLARVAVKRVASRSAAE
jgi:hypothetical protein